MQACLSVRKDREISFHDCGVAEYRVEAGLSCGEVGQTHFNYYTGLVKLVQASLIAGKIDKAVFMTVEWLSNAYKAV